MCSQCAALFPNHRTKREGEPHSATELKADSGFLQRIRQRMALQVPELGVIPRVPGQKRNWHLGEQEQHQKKNQGCKFAHQQIKAADWFLCFLRMEGAA